MRDFLWNGPQLRVALVSSGGRERSLAVPARGLLAVLAALLILAAVPWWPGPRLDAVDGGMENVVPLQAMDPAALVMGPLGHGSAGGCSCRERRAR